MNKITGLNSWHRAHGANMATFGGYDMPLWYGTGARAEHLAVLTAAGVFDTSHMAALRVTGPGAFALLQYCHTKDLGTALGAWQAWPHANRCTYGVFLDEQGGVIDDAIVGRLAPESYLVVVNAGMGPSVAKHLAARGGDVRIEDFTNRLGKIDLQGPAAARVLEPLLADPDGAFDGLGYFTFKGHFQGGEDDGGRVRLVDGTPLLLSRTGYTGEFGFELYVEVGALVRVWEMLLESGAGLGVIACGLAARDSLRAGAVLPLSHQDIGPWPFCNNPWRFALPLAADGTSYTKDFLGRRALESLRSCEPTYPFLGYDVRKVTAHDGTARVFDLSGRDLGVVLSCVTDMGIGRHGGRVYSVASPDQPAGFTAKGLSCGFVRVADTLAPGDEILLKDPKREVRAQIVSDVRPDRTARNPIQSMRAEASARQ